MSTYAKKPTHDDLPIGNRMSYADQIRKAAKNGQLDERDYIFTKTKDGETVRPKQIAIEHVVDSNLKIKSWNGASPK